MSDTDENSDSGSVCGYNDEYVEEGEEEEEEDDWDIKSTKSHMSMVEEIEFSLSGRTPRKLKRPKLSSTTTSTNSPREESPESLGGGIGKEEEVINSDMYTNPMCNVNVSKHFRMDVLNKVSCFIQIICK
jgi:hypothetical protein